MSSNPPYRATHPAPAPTTMSPTQLSMPSDPSQGHPHMPPPLSHPPYHPQPQPHAHNPYAGFATSHPPPQPHGPPHGGHVPLSPTNPRKRRYSEDTIPTPTNVAPALGVPPHSAVTYPEPPEGPYTLQPGAGGMVGRDVGLVSIDTGGHVPGVAMPPPSTPQGPPPKKSRTNTPWTPAEEQKLKTLRDAGSSWSEIAKEFPGRTEGSVKKHWYKDMHYAEFAADESAALLAAIKDYEASKWKVIGQKLGKPAKACEQYAKEHFGGKI